MVQISASGPQRHRFPVLETALVPGPRALPLSGQQQQNLPESARVILPAYLSSELCREDDDRRQKAQPGLVTSSTNYMLCSSVVHGFACVTETDYSQ